MSAASAAYCCHSQKHSKTQVWLHWVLYSNAQDMPEWLLLVRMGYLADPASLLPWTSLRLSDRQEYSTSKLTYRQVLARRFKVEKYLWASMKSAAVYSKVSTLSRLTLGTASQA